MSCIKPLLEKDKIKCFYTQNNIGMAKYVIHHYDGNKKHPDGSNFFDIAIFKNKKKFTKFLLDLKNSGYVVR